MVKPVRKVNHKRVIRLPPPKVKPHDPLPSPYVLPLQPSSKEEELQKKLDRSNQEHIEDLKKIAFGERPEVSSIQVEKNTKGKDVVTVIKFIFAPGKLETGFDKFIYTVKIIGFIVLVGMAISLVILFR